MTDIARLFQEDPLKLTRDDITVLCDYYRDARKNFNNGEKAAGSTKKVKETAAAKPKVEKLDLDKLLG